MSNRMSQDDRAEFLRGVAGAYATRGMAGTCELLNRKQQAITRWLNEARRLGVLPDELAACIRARELYEGVESSLDAMRHYRGAEYAEQVRSELVRLFQPEQEHQA